MDLFICLCVQVFGHEKVSVLDGGLPKWKKLGFPLVTGPQGAVSASHFTATYDPSLVRTLDQVKEAVENKTHQVWKPSTKIASRLVSG